MAKTYVNRNRKSPRYKQRYTKGKGGSHVYTIKGKRVVIGGKRPARKPVDPYKAELDAATAVRYSEQERQIGSERRISEQAARNQGSWWGQYQQEVAAAEQRANQGYKGAVGQIQNQANTSYQQDTAADAARLAEANRQAALRGTTASEGDAGQAASARRALSSAMAGKVAYEGANQAAYGARQTATAAGVRASKLGEEAARRRQIEKALRDLQADKGQWRVDMRRQLKDAYHKKRLEILTFEGKAAAEAFDQQMAQQREGRLSAADRRAARKDRRDARRKAKIDRYRDVHQGHGHEVTEYGGHKIPGSGKGGGGGGGGGGKGTKVRSAPGYGRTNVSLPVAVTNRRDWENLVADSKRVNRIPKKAKGLMRTVLAEYASPTGGRGKVSKRTALKVWRTYGFRLPYGKPRGLRRPGNAPGPGGRQQRPG